MSIDGLSLLISPNAKIATTAFLACKDEHVANLPGPGYSFAAARSTGIAGSTSCAESAGKYPLIDVAYRPTPCMHCDQAPCIRARKADGEVYKRPKTAL